MSIIELQQAFDLISAHQDQADFEGFKEEDLIRKAETALGLEFPPTYRQFLKEYGCGDFAGQEFYGIINENFENSSIPNGIWLTLDERKSGLPDNLIVIYATGDGAYYALDAAQRNDSGEYAVVAWTPGASKEMGDSEKIAEDFGEFLLAMLQRSIV